MNKVMLVGNLGADADLRQTNSGTSVLNLRLATGDQYTDKDGNKKKFTEWHRVAIFGRTADTLATYLVKGKQVSIEGKMETHEWIDPKGHKRFTTQVVIRPGRGRIELMGGGRKKEDVDTDSGDSQPPF